MAAIRKLALEAKVLILAPELVIAVGKTGPY